MKKISAITSVLIISVCCMAYGVPSKGLNIHLPREVALSGNIIHLKDIAILRANPELLKKAGQVALGKLTMAGQTVNIDRKTILSRLASSKINTAKIYFSGSDQINVELQETKIRSSELAKKAEAFLNENNNNHLIHSFDLARVPKDIVLPLKNDFVKLLPSSLRQPSPSQTIVTVDAYISGKKLSSHEVSFRPNYKCRKAVIKKDIAAGTMLSTDNTEIETYISPRPEPKDWKSPHGLITKSSLKKGMTVRSSQLMAQRPQILIERKDLVMIKIQTPQLSIIANGEAMAKGAFGDIIKVRNIDSRRMIVCRVNHDGTVSPVF